MHRDLHLPDRLILERCPWEDMLPLTVMLPSHDPVNLNHNKGLRESERKHIYFLWLVSSLQKIHFLKEEEMRLSPRQLCNSNERRILRDPITSLLETNASIFSLVL